MLEINHPSDILMPFTQIGEEGWEQSTHRVLLAWADNWSRELAQAVSDLQISQLEQRLGTRLPNGLRLFYQTFGIADIGEELQSFDDIDWIKDIWAAAPEYGPDFTEADRKILPKLITFSDYLGNGNMFCFHADTHEVYYFDHDCLPYFSRLFATVDDYIRACLIVAQADLFGADIDQTQVEGWVESKVIELFGDDVVKKWRY